MAPREARSSRATTRSFSEEKWQAVGATARYGIDFASASPTQKKGASYLFLEEHMKALIGHQERACVLP